MDGNTSTAVVMTVVIARQNMLENVKKLEPVPYYINKNGNLYRRRTLSEKNAGEGFWVMYKWGLENFELHVHYSTKGKIKGEFVKVTGANMRGGQCFLDSNQLSAIRSKIDTPPMQ